MLISSRDPSPTRKNHKSFVLKKDILTFAVPSSGSDCDDEEDVKAPVCSDFSGRSRKTGEPVFADMPYIIVFPSCIFPFFIVKYSLSANGKDFRRAKIFSDRFRRLTPRLYGSIKDRIQYGGGNNVLYVN